MPTDVTLRRAPESKNVLAVADTATSLQIEASRSNPGMECANDPSSAVLCAALSPSCEGTRKGKDLR